MLFIVVVVFVLLHIPFAVQIFIRENLVKNQDTLTEINHRLLSNIANYSLYMNAAINPVIYGLTNDNFRRAYHQTPILPTKISRKWSTIAKKLQHKKVC